MKTDVQPILSSAILAETEAFIKSLFAEKLPASVVFHTLEHTYSVVKSATKIGEKKGLQESELETVLMAAWFLDTGYCFDVEHPEPESLKVANKFLLEKEYPARQIERIAACMVATRGLQNPQNIPEQVLCDASLAYLASKKFTDKSELLRQETSLLKSLEIAPKDWLEQNLKLLKKHEFFTPYGKNKLAIKQNKNYEKTRKLLKALEKEQSSENYKKTEKAVKNSPTPEEKKPGRGIETMFRTTSHNHLELGAMADNKANIMITINSINISLVISILFRKFEEFPNLIIPTAFLTLVCLLTIVFAILATRPVITMGKFNREDLRAKQTNLLFFGNFHKMSLEDYEWGVKEIMKDNDLLYSNLIHDIYYLGRVLGRKYELLRMCYNIFMYGIILSILAYAIALIFFPVK